MKALIALLIIVSVANPVPAFAEDFACKSVFDQKLKQLDKTSGIRRAGRVALYTVAGFAGMSLVFTGLGMTATGVLLFGGIFGIPSGASIGSDSVSPKEREYRIAYETQSLMSRSHAELIAEISKKRDESIRIAIEKFESEASHPEYLRALVAKVNHARLQAGLPYIGPEEVVAITKENIRTSILNGELVITNVISESLAKLKRKKWVDPGMTYDAFRTILQGNESHFCPNGEALPLKTVLKKMFKGSREYPVRKLIL